MAPPRGLPPGPDAVRGPGVKGPSDTTQGSADAAAPTAHRFDLRVYYEDTDLAGIVYYANYLRFIERGRSEWVRDRGLDQVRLRADAGIVFAVRRVEADYLHPAVFDDLLTVETRLLTLGGARVVLRQDVTREGATLFRAQVVLVCMRADGRPVRVPGPVRAALLGAAAPPSGIDRGAQPGSPDRR